MVRNYIALVALGLVISEAKLFIGDCSYGFCEQKCTQIRSDEMECFCNRGFALQGDGRKCIKSFNTDDEVSSGDEEASGEIGNCDNEDGNCDTTQTVIVFSGDSDDDSLEEGSGDLPLIRFVKSSSGKVIRTNVTAKLTSKSSIGQGEVVTRKTMVNLIKILIVPSTTILSAMPTRIDDKHTGLKKTIKEIHPIVGETVKLLTESLLTKTYELINVRTQIDNRETSTASFKAIVSIITNNEIIGRFKSPIINSTHRQPTSSTGYFLVSDTRRISTTPTQYSRKTAIVGDKSKSVSPLQRATSRVRVGAPLDKTRTKTIQETSSYKHILVETPMVSNKVHIKQSKSDPPLQRVTSRVKVGTPLDKTRTKTIQETSSYKHILVQTPMVSNKVHIKQSYTTSDNILPIPTVERRSSEIKKYDVREDNKVYLSVDSKHEYPKTKVTTVATIPRPGKTFIDVAMTKIPVVRTIKMDEHAIPLKVTIVKQDRPTPSITNTIQPDKRIVPVTINVTKSESKSSKNIVQISTIKSERKKSVHPIEIPIKDSITSMLTKSSFHTSMPSPEIIEKTTPLLVVSTVLLTSTKSYASSDLLIISEKGKRTTVKPSKRGTSSSNVSYSVGLSKTEKLDKKSLIQSTPSRHVTATGSVNITVTTGVKQNHQSRLMVNYYFLALITTLTIYFFNIQ